MIEAIATSQSILRRVFRYTHLKPPTANKTGMQETKFSIMKIISVLSKFSYANVSHNITLKVRMFTQVCVATYTRLEIMAR